MKKPSTIQDALRSTIRALGRDQEGISPYAISELIFDPGEYARGYLPEKTTRKKKAKKK